MSTLQFIKECQEKVFSGIRISSEDAEKLFSAAEQYSASTHIKALVAYNRSISAFEAGEIEKAKQQFEAAIGFAKNRIKTYVKYSVYGQSLVQNIEEFNEFIPKQN